MNKEEALALLEAEQAPAQLVQHVLLVSEAAELLIQHLATLGVEFDAQLVRVGVLLHDIGKTRHTNELHEAGSIHQQAGEQLLLQRGVDSVLARVCRTHGEWQDPSCSLEELLIALADKLWKGARVEALEERVIHMLSEKLWADYWELYPQLDRAFEQIAQDGDQRLARSV